MSEKKKIYKPKTVSGFPEWLPEVRMVEQQWLDQIRRTFESYGYVSIETPAVEELNVISAKGEDVDKEIYVIERLHKEDGDKEARLALHFDQTVPFARYAAMYFNDLVFPFKRYQMQKVWRGERPQAGRMREFYQCDIDVINPDNLPLSFDAEMPAIIWEILSNLPGMENENFQLHISNRKILMGFLRSLNINDTQAVIRIIDKLGKIGGDEVQRILMDELNIDNALTAKIMNTVSTIDLDQLKAENDLMQEGIHELKHVMSQLSHIPLSQCRVNLSMVRGLDYYTGTIYETVFHDDPGYGSICSGGRYDDLAGSYINKHLPGVGISIGFSRLFDRLRTQGKLPIDRKCPSDVLVLPARDDEGGLKAQAIAQKLRSNDHNVEIATGKKLQKQIGYAEKKGIPYVWFAEDGEVKNLSSGEQVQADPESWSA